MGVPLGCRLPSRVLHKRIVHPQVGGGPGPVGAPGDQLCGQPQGEAPILGYLKDPLFIRQKPLGRHGLAHPVLVVVGTLHPPVRALEQAVVPLGVEKPLLVKPRLLELVVHVGGDDEVLLLPHQVQQPVIHRLGGGHVAVEIDVSGPPGPLRLLIREGIEATGIHIPDAEFLVKIEEIPLKALSIIHKSRGGGEPRPRADDHGVRPVDGLPQPRKPLLPAAPAPGQPTEAIQRRHALLNGVCVAVFLLSENAHGNTFSLAAPGGEIIL